jgi:hypothetical protein
MHTQLKPLALSHLSGRIETPPVEAPAVPPEPASAPSEPILRSDWITMLIFAICFSLLLIIHIYEAIAGWLWR